MDGLPFPLRLGRSGGTTDADLRACARFVFGRPGWSAAEVATGRGDTGITLRTRGGNGTANTWHLRRMGGGLTATDAAGCTTFRDVATTRELLVLVWEAETSGAAAA